MEKVQNKLSTSENDAPASEPCRIKFISQSPTYPHGVVRSILAIFSTFCHQNVTTRMCEFVWLQHWQHLIQDLVVCLVAHLIMYACFKLCTIL